MLSVLITLLETLGIILTGGLIFIASLVVAALVIFTIKSLISAIKK